MELLYLLEGIRVPFFDTVLGALTYLGDEIVATVIILIVLWCFSKKAGYYLFYVIMFSTSLNQFLKHTFRIPRPWVLDPNFTIVENARAAATGYSFPSGHTASAVGIYGGLCFWLKKAWQRVLLISVAVIVMFSRLYLGVHTPLDVGVSLGIGLILIFGIWFWYNAADTKKLLCWLMNGVLVAFSVVLLVYVLVNPTVETELQNSALKNAWTLVGMTTGLVAAQFIDNRWVRFDTKGVWWVQLLKTAVGLGLIVGFRALVKQPLYALFGGSYAADAVRYFCIVVIGGALYPMTFTLWNKLDKRSRVDESAV